MKRELWLYGSVARGVQTDASDLDLLMVPEVDELHEQEVEHLITSLPQSHRRAVTTYTWPQLATMAAYGSLFLVHLKLEGRLLHTSGRGPGLRELVEHLPDYRRADHDVRGFAHALLDVQESLREGGDPNYELGVVATVVRHCSILATYLAGELSFDRVESISSALAAAGMGELIADTLDLHEYRLARLGRRQVPAASADLAMHRTQSALEFVREVTQRYGLT